MIFADTLAASSAASFASAWASVVAVWEVELLIAVMAASIGPRLSRISSYIVNHAGDADRPAASRNGRPRLPPVPRRVPAARVPRWRNRLLRSRAEPRRSTGWRRREHRLRRWSGRRSGAYGREFRARSSGA